MRQRNVLDDNEWPGWFTSYEKLFPKGNDKGNMEIDRTRQMVQSCFSEFHKERNNK